MTPEIAQKLSGVERLIKKGDVRRAGLKLVKWVKKGQLTIEEAKPYLIRCRQGIDMQHKVMDEANKHTRITAIPLSKGEVMRFHHRSHYSYW